MLIYKSACYDDFHCIASACPDSCCKEWEVLVDADTAARYRSLSGPLGDDLRSVLRDENGDTYLTIQDGRCPMWRQDGLCRIQAQLGEAALCQTCRDFPRLRHDYGAFQQWGLELSCPEAARLILHAPSHPEQILELPGGEPGDYEMDAMQTLLATRQVLHKLLQDTTRPMGELLALVLLYGCQAQGQLDGGEGSAFDAEAALASARAMAKPGSIREILDLFSSLEILTERWRQCLMHPVQQPWDSRTPALARYLADRYWLQAVSDYDLYSRVKFLVVACLVIHHIPGDFLQRAQLFSKEVENNWENVEAILDAAYTHKALTDDRLFGLLLSEEKP